MAPVTWALLGANVAVFLLQLAGGLPLIEHFALWPPATSGPRGGPPFEAWQLVSYSFLHGSLLHLAFNMFALYMFGSALERVFGGRRYAVLYFASVVTAAITQLLFAAVSGGVYPTVGASGGVFGLLLAYAIYFPHNRIMLLFPPVPMPARVFVILYAAIELFLGVTGTQEGVAHFAHLGGMVGAWLLLRMWRGGVRRPLR